MGFPTAFLGSLALACILTKAEIGSCQSQGQGSCAQGATAPSEPAETTLIQRIVRSSKSRYSNSTEYDCNGDGLAECRLWDVPGGGCANEKHCMQVTKVGDLLLDDSCRCRTPEYDCDGDGQPDCGLWDRPGARCANPLECSPKSKLGDTTMDQSCRCKRTDYDCNSDGAADCGSWNNRTQACDNRPTCGLRSRPSDETKDQSCRCVFTDYDCNGDGKADCGVWDYSKTRCMHNSHCGREFRLTDPSLDASCRCAKTDYDCSGDGVAECGIWDYQKSMCKNQDYCGYMPKGGDFTLDQACRCRRCDAPEYFGTAFADMQLKRPDKSHFDAVSWGTFNVWADHLDTCAPWVMPTDDNSLRSVLKYARDRGYQVRISGAAHSAGGLATDGKDPNVFVLSLGDYVAPGEWQFGLTDLPDGSKRATVNAGWTQLHLYAKVRHLGYFLPAQTAGYFFQLGGIVANSVHGGGYNRGFIHSYVTRLRVMLHDGEIAVVDREEDLRYWRNSFGLLGIILGIEFQLEKRERLQMYVEQRNMKTWGAEDFWKFIKEDAEADLPLDVVSEGGSHGTRAAWNGEYFVDFINGGDEPRIAVYSQKANSSVDADRSDVWCPQDVQANYESLLTSMVNDGRHGRQTYDVVSRRDGAPPVEILGIDVNDFLKDFRLFDLSRLLSLAAIGGIANFVRGQRAKLNDGFFLKRSPAALASAFFFPPEKAFEAMDFLRTVQLESLKGSPNFVWNLPGEFRFINISDSAVLQPAAPGLWFNAQMISFADLAKTDQAWKKAFAKVERYWVDELGAKPHMGKLWGFEYDKHGVVEPFSKSYSCRIYSAEQKAAFSAYRSRLDPDDLFASGLGMQLLAPCHG